MPATLTNVAFGSWGNASDGSNAAQLTFLVGVAATVSTQLTFLVGVAATVSIFQDTEVAFLPDSIYTLTFDADQASALSLLSGASASIFAGVTPVATLSGASLLTLLDGSGPMHSFSLQYTTGASAPAGNIGIGFSAGGLAEVAGAGIVVDNVRLDVTPVPEPGSAALVALVGSCFLLARRRNGSLLCDHQIH